MQKLLFVILFVFGFLSANAQDTIIKNSGERILAKVFEIGLSEVKFKKYNFESGPTYIEDKSQIKAIHFSNGQKEEFRKEDKNIYSGSDDYVSQTPSNPPASHKIDIAGNRFYLNGRVYREREIQDMLLATNDKKIVTLIGSSRDAKKFQYIGFGAFPLGIAGLTVLGKGLYQAQSTTGTKIKVRPENAVVAIVCLAATITCPVLSGINKNKRHAYNREAVRLYNEKY